MIPLLMALVAETLTGGLLVCSEAHTLPWGPRVAVAATVAARVRETGWSAIRVMRAPRAYAPHLCPALSLELGHIEAYLAGRWGFGPAWTRDAYAFFRIPLMERHGERWRRRGLVPYHKGPAHWWWKRKEPLPAVPN